jgi:hypothetical protein
LTAVVEVVRMRSSTEGVNMGTLLAVVVGGIAGLAFGGIVVRIADRIANY